MIIDQDEWPELTGQFDGLSVFVVGGWVRDKLRPDAEANDVDLMVAGVSPEEMESRGFDRVDNSNGTFGVFLDGFNREVALAREESSTGERYTDFEVEPVPADVSVQDAVRRDLERRDFTVNAMAVPINLPDDASIHVKEGTLVDPHGGVSDLSTRTLRAVNSDAFREDPLRVVRGARFASRLNAEADNDTFKAMSDAASRIPDLPQERVRMEMEKTFKQADRPSIFFDTLVMVDALHDTFPELAALREVPAGPEPHHREGSAYRHTMMVMDEMARIREGDELALLMAMAHDLGKAVTLEEDLPNHPNHGKQGLPIIEDMCDRLAMSNEQEDVMKDAARWHMPMNNIEELRESTVIDMEQEVHDTARLVSLSAADSRGRSPSTEFDQPTAFGRLLCASRAIEEWTGERLIEEGYSPAEMGGKNFGDLLRQKRVEFMRRLEQ